MLALLKLHSD